MSFIDYGFDIFPYVIQNGSTSLLNYGKKKHLKEKNNSLYLDLICRNENFSYLVIIEHLIDLGTYAENKLTLARKEIEKYKSIQLTQDQIEKLKNVSVCISCNKKSYHFISLLHFRMIFNAKVKRSKNYSLKILILVRLFILFFFF